MTITFGFGPASNGCDRFGLAARRRAALVDLPRFNGDQLVPEKTGGDLMIQACANDAQVAFHAHAVRQLARMGTAADVTTIRWVRRASCRAPRDKTPRNLMGFKDGTNNPPTAQPRAMNQFVWADGADAAWMKGGTYTVVRRIRYHARTLGHDGTRLSGAGVRTSQVQTAARPSARRMNSIRSISMPPTRTAIP